MECYLMTLIVPLLGHPFVPLVMVRLSVKPVLLVTCYENCLAHCCDCLYGEYWFRLSRYVYDGNRSFASFTKTKSVESAV
jgi:hypothetical protein